MFSILLFLVISEFSHFLIVTIDGVLKFLSSHFLFEFEFDFSSFFLILHFVFKPSFLFLMPSLGLFHFSFVPFLSIFKLTCMFVLHTLGLGNVLLFATSLLQIELTKLCLVLVIAIPKGIGMLCLHLLGSIKMILLLFSQGIFKFSLLVSHLLVLLLNFIVMVLIHLINYFEVLVFAIIHFSLKSLYFGPKFFYI